MGKYKKKFKSKKNDKLIKLFIIIFAVITTMAVGNAILTDTLEINGTANILPQQTGSYTIVYDANGGTGTMAPQTVNVGATVNLTANSFVNGTYPFSHWNTKADGTGTDYYDSQSIKDIAGNGQTVTLYAQWAFNVAKIGTTYYSSLQAAINAVQANGIETKVELLRDVSENLTVAAGKVIDLDLKNHTNSITNKAILTNNGTVKITNGTLLSNSSSDGAINNNSTGTLIVSGGNIIMNKSNGKQAIYNDRGTVTITGTAYIRSESGKRQ